MRYFVIPYTKGSKSAETAARAMPDGKLIRLEGSQYKPQAGDLIVNWGKLRPQEYLPRLPAGVKLLNPDTRITDKLDFFKALTLAGAADIIPRYWTNRRSIPADAYPVFCRTTDGHAGKGIVIAETAADLVEAPLYTQYIRSNAEYRVHMGINRALPEAEAVQAIGFQQKLRKNGVYGGEQRIKHLQNGYIYGRSTKNDVPAVVIAVARAAFLTTGLDFGAFDIVYDADNRRAYVLEVNTAPDIEGVDIQGYANFFVGVNEALNKAVVAKPEQPAPVARPAVAAPAPAPVAKPAPAAVVVVGGSQKFSVTVGVAFTPNVDMVIEADSMEEAVRLAREQAPGQFKPVVTIESVSLQR